MRCVHQLLRNRPFLTLSLCISLAFTAFLAYALSQRPNYTRDECAQSGYTFACVRVFNGTCYGTSWSWARAADCAVMGATTSLGADYARAAARAAAQFANVQYTRNTPFECWVRACGGEFRAVEPADAHGAAFAVVISCMLAVMVGISAAYVWLIYHAEKE